jgi:hypothetical protein
MASKFFQYFKWPLAPLLAFIPVTQTYDEMSERIEKNLKYHNEREQFDKIRHVFAHSGYTEEQIINYLEENKIDVNDTTCSFVYGIYQPIFFWMYNKRQVLDHFLKKKQIDPTRSIEIDDRNPYTHDFLDSCKIEDIPKLVEYGFKIKPNDHCKKYFNIYNIRRMLKFTEHGLLEFKSLEACATKEKLNESLFDTHQSIYIDIEKYGELNVQKHEDVLLTLLDIYERFNKKYEVDHDKFKGGWFFGVAQWDLTRAREFFENIRSQ